MAWNLYRESLCGLTEIPVAVLGLAIRQIEKTNGMRHWMPPVTTMTYGIGKGELFWGQEIFRPSPTSRATRGGRSARWRNNNNANLCPENVGFWPMLKPLPLTMDVSDSLVGKRVRVYWEKRYISGRLVDYSDYDIVLETDISPTLLDRCRNWACLNSERMVVVDRASVVYMKQL